MNIAHLRNLVISKPIEVTFTKGVEIFESFIDECMVGDIIQISEPDENDIVKVWIDFIKHEEHNKKFMKHNYYDRIGIPRLNAYEAGEYPRNNVEMLYMMETDEVESFAKINHLNPLYEEYKTAGFFGTYAEWLEEIVTKLRG